MPAAMPEAHSEASPQPRSASPSKSPRTRAGTSAPREAHPAAGAAAKEPVDPKLAWRGKIGGFQKRLSELGSDGEGGQYVQLRDEISAFVSNARPELLDSALRSQLGRIERVSPQAQAELLKQILSNLGGK
jgi:hypothetical protein